MLQARFPNDFRLMLKVMNGTDIPTLNVYGSCGDPCRTGAGVYSYPRDLEEVRERMHCVQRHLKEIKESLQEDGYELQKEAVLVPVYGHRFIVCGQNPAESVVLSICDTDAIVYATTLQEYLQQEFLGP